jgi:hypothetical protein
VAARFPNDKPVRRAARWDGLFPIDLGGPEDLARMTARVRELRDPQAGPFDVAVTNPAGTDPVPWEAAGATWCLTGFGSEPRAAGVEAAIAAQRHR